LYRFAQFGFASGQDKRKLAVTLLKNGIDFNPGTITLARE
jgi:hypothetical protein